MSGALDGAGGGDGDGDSGGCVAGPEYGKGKGVVVNTEEVESSDADADADPAHTSPPVEQRESDDTSTPSSRTLPVDEREAPRAGSADDERSGSGPEEAEEEEEDMGPPRRRRDAFGAAYVSDLDLDSVGKAPGDEELGGGDAGAGMAESGVEAGSLAGPSSGVDDGADAGLGSGVGAGPEAGQSTGLSVLETIRQLQSLDYTSSSGSSTRAAAPNATHDRETLGLDTDTPAMTNEGIRGFRTRLRHRPDVANFSRPLSNSHADRSQPLNLDGGVATPDTATLAEVNGSLSDDENRPPLSLQRTRSSKYRYKGKGKEVVYHDPQDMDRSSIASSTASAEPRRKRQEREPGQPFGHQPESSRDAVATPPADEPSVNTSSLQPESSRDDAIATSPADEPLLTTPSPLSLPGQRDHQIRAGPGDGGATDRDPGHWSLAPREDATTNTAAEEATRMTVEWLRRSDAEGTSPVDRVEGGSRRDWEVGLRRPLP
ncbi:hypothetical protein LTR12_016184 [Friedmanniomyces endolithicus]|nr:hypothetical protein LTR74_012319 [Friedmanniomyces endolithicus]KAK1809445.1 hypothetical protein LTR12_016184 [Friedmanniomyces endolithicus]